MTNIGTLQRLNGINRLQVGDPVRVRRSRSPLSGMAGKVAAITLDDPYGPYLVVFENGLQFRYWPHELVVLTYFFHSATNNR